MTEQEYNEIPAIRSSYLKNSYGQSMAYAKFKKDEPQKSQNVSTKIDALNFGIAFHALVLEPDRTDEVIKRMPEFGRKKDDLTAKAEWLKDNHKPECVVMREQEYSQALAMAVAVREHAGASKLLDGCAFESLCTGELSSVDCKARFDAFNGNEDYIIDLKSASDPSPIEFMKSANNFGYDISAGLSCKLYQLAYGKMPRFLFIVVGKNKPHEVVIYEATMEFLDNGTEIVNGELERWSHCLALETWPGYDDEIFALELPGWVR